jgi:hypothetical protein
MAKLDGNIRFTGSIENLSAYTMRGHDKIILRSKGGARKLHIKTKASFETTRKLNTEWQGVTQTAVDIRGELTALKPLADYNISGPVNALVKKIQNNDAEHPKGTRSILLSRHLDFFSSFQFNRQTLFDTVIREPIAVHIDRSTGLATARIPALHPAVNFFSHPKYGYYRMILVFVALSDYTWNETVEQYRPLLSELPVYDTIYTGWSPTISLQPATDFQFTRRNSILPGPDMMLIFGAGIQYGMPSADGSIQPVPYAGAARILKTV